MLRKFTLFWVLALPISIQSMAQKDPNYDESKVPALALPDIFVSERGKFIQSKDEWETIRRPEIFKLFEREVYGQIPKDFDQISFQVAEETTNPYSEISILEKVSIQVERNGKSHTMRLNFFLPKTGNGPFPVILFINYKPTYAEGKVNEEGFWPVKELLERGFATASFHAETVAPDLEDSFQAGVIANLYPEQIGQPNGMKALGAWGWGAMRAMDYFAQHPQIDAQKSILVGFSRSGKAALWASANDPRWTITFANESGCGGAALSKRKYGETVGAINRRFPHWFADNFHLYNEQEELLPLDQHMLPGLIAPRALYYASAKEDRWADPKGEYLGLQLGSRVYSSIYDKDAAFQPEFEQIQAPIHLESVGYHYREGPHNLTWEDWRIFLEFVQKNL